MSIALAVIIAGDAFELSGGATLAADSGDLCEIWLVGKDGLGIAPSARLRERGPLQNGETDLGFRLQSRTFQVAWGVKAPTEALLEDGLVRLMYFLKPDQNLGMRWTLANGDVRQIDCHIQGGLHFGSKERRGFYQSVAASFNAADPTFYDPTPEELEFSVGTEGTGIPMPVPTPVGYGTINITSELEYLGDWREYPVIRIAGPITDPRLVNSTTDETLDFTGTTIAAGDYYDIDCRYGYKTVLDSAGINRIDKLSSDSDLATWHLAAHPEALNGINELTVIGLGVNGDTALTVTFYKRYIGIP